MNADDSKSDSTLETDSEAPTQNHPETSSDEGRGRPRTWREDALSVFLIAAAVLLGGMYAYDQWQASRLDEQISRANKISQSFAVDGADCEVSSTGLRGETLMVSCSGLEAKRVAELAGAIDTLMSQMLHFEHVIFRGVDSQLRCPPESKHWTEACEQEQVPSVE